MMMCPGRKTCPGTATHCLDGYQIDWQAHSVEKIFQQKYDALYEPSPQP